MSSIKIKLNESINVFKKDAECETKEVGVLQWKTNKLADVEAIVNNWRLLAMLKPENYKFSQTDGWARLLVVIDDDYEGNFSEYERTITWELAD